MTDEAQPSRALQALTAAALALPAMAANAADGPSFNIQFGHYEEGKRDLDGQTYKGLNLKPLHVDSFEIRGAVPITDRLTFKANFDQDSWSGATPVVSLPSAAVQAQLLSGASSPNFFHIDRNGTPYVVDFNQYDPNTDTYAHQAHPGLVHVMASASPETRRQWDGSVSQEWDQAELTIGAGISDEHDYLSKFANIGGKFEVNNKLTVFNWGASATFNRIRASLAANSAADTGNYSDQIHDYDGAPTIFGRRKDYAANVGITQILNRNALIQADLSYTRSSGFLENPYKAVIFAFDDPDQPFDNSGLKYVPIKGSLEQRPDLRSQWALNVKLAQNVRQTGSALHLNYRFYRDDWGIRSHTLDVSLEQPFGSGWLFTPDVRYYTQTAASFYAPYFLFGEAFPAHPGGPLDRDKIPLKYFSSDERLSAFGALSGSLAVQKSLGHGVALNLSYEYYLHKGNLKLGGRGEPSYADFHSSLVSAGLAMDLARRQDELNSRNTGGATGVPDGPLTRRSAGLLMPDVLRPGALSLTAAFASTSWGGPVEFANRPVGNNELIANACGKDACSLAPTKAGRNDLQFQLSYALSPQLTLSVMPTYVENSIALEAVYPDYFGALPPLGGPSGNGRHSTSAWGDTPILASFDLTPHSIAHVRFGGGVSVPTGQAGRTLNGKTDYVGYSLQTGSGTWDAIGVFDIEANSGPFGVGAELSEVKRLGIANKFGYRLGDEFQTNAWIGTEITPWLSLTGRFRLDSQGRIHEAYKDHLEHKVPFTELEQVDYDVNGDGVIDSNDVDYVTVYRDALEPHVVASPDDLAANHGGTFVDAGLGLTFHAPSGPFKGDRLTVEWLRPISTSANGYQLRRQSSVNGRVTIAI